MTQIDGYLKHSTLRGAERYGLEINIQEYASLSARIGLHGTTHDPKCVRLCHAAGGREKWAIWYKGEWIPLVFDPVQRRIVTLLPKRELRPFLAGLPW